MLVLIHLRVKQLYFLLESVAIKCIPVSKSNHYPEILKLTDQILETFGISRIKKHQALLIQYIYNSEYTVHFMDDVLDYLTKMADKTLTGDIEDFVPSKFVAKLKEEHDQSEEDDNWFEDEMNQEWEKIEEERENRLKALRSLPRTLEPEAVKKYLVDHLEFRLTDKEFEDISNGFLLFWRYSDPQKAGDLNFQWAVDQYLSSIDSPMDRKKVGQVVDSILEYLQEIRLWGYPE